MSRGTRRAAWWLLLGSLAGCSEAKPGQRAPASFIEMSNGGALNFRSAHASGSVATGTLALRSQTVQQGASSESRWTVDGIELDFLGAELRIGGQGYGPLAGESRIVISREGVTVNGERRGGFPP